MKDKLFNQSNVKHLSDLLKNVYEEFDCVSFENKILQKFPDLELKERISWVRKNIEDFLLGDFVDTLDILQNSLSYNPKKRDFIFAAFSDYVSVNGCDKKNLDKSLLALGKFTKYFSAEFAIRFFINKFPTETFAKMQNWSFSNDLDQRRLASEGLRPKLPWAKAITFDYKKGSSILDNLFFDDSRYVTRSVANHLNDISKIDPDFVVEKLKKWQNSNKQEYKEMQYIIYHSLRTSIKNGHKKTLEFLGFNSNPKISISNFKIKNKNLRIGDSLEFSLDVLAEENENLIIDYKIIYPTPHKRVSQKVFKLKKMKINSSEKITIEKSHLFRIMTTKKLHTGDYEIQIQINGSIFNTDSFYLKVD